MANTCRHGRPYSVTCDFCRVEGSGGRIRDDYANVPPRWRVPKDPQDSRFSSLVCYHCSPPKRFKEWGLLYAHVQSHIDDVKGGASELTYPDPSPPPDFTIPKSNRVPSYSPPSQPKTLCKRRARSQENVVHDSTYKPVSRRPERIVRACLLFGALLSLVGLFVAVMVLLEVPTGYYLP